MLEIIIKLLQATLQANTNVEDVFSLAQIIKEDDKKYPAVYNTDGEYDTFEDSENYIYFRQTGRIRRQERPSEGVSACDDLLFVHFPLCVVAYVPKDIYHSDDNFIDEKVGNNISNLIINANWGALTGAVQADLARVEINDIETDREEVWKQEYDNIPMSAQFDHVLVKINFTVVIEISQSCLVNFDCNLIDVIIDGTVIDISIRSTDINAWHKGGDNVPEEKTIGTITNFDFPVITNNVKRWLFDKGGDFLPSVMDTYNIGSPTSRVNKVYAKEVIFDSGTIRSINTLTEIDQLLVTGSAGTDFDIVSLGDTHTFNLPTASALNRGALSSVDWSRFNAAYNLRHPALSLGAATNGLDLDAANQIIQLFAATDTQAGSVTTIAQRFGGTKTFMTAPVINTLNIGSVLFLGPSKETAESNQFFFDAATNSLGIGLNSGFLAKLNVSTNTRRGYSIAYTYTLTADNDNGARIIGTVTGTNSGTRTNVGHQYTIGLIAAVAGHTYIGSREDVTFTMGAFGGTGITKLITSNTNVNFLQFNNLAQPYTLGVSGLTVGLNSSNGLLFGRAGIGLLFGTNGSSVGNADTTGNWALGGNFAAAARVHLRGLLNGEAFLVDTSTGNPYIRCREVATVRQMGFNGVTPIPRPLLPIGATTADIATVLDSLGLTRLI